MKTIEDWYIEFWNQTQAFFNCPQMLNLIRQVRDEALEEAAEQAEKYVYGCKAATAIKQLKEQP